MSKYQFELHQGMFKGTSGYALSVTTAAATAFSNIPTVCIRALCSIEGDGIRYRYDGTAPTINTGHIVDSGGVIAIYGKDNLNNFSVIAISGTAGASLFITYEVDFR